MWLDWTHISQSVLSHISALETERSLAGYAVSYNLAVKYMAYEGARVIMKLISYVSPKSLYRNSDRYLFYSIR